MKYGFQDLDWDTKYFGIKSGKIILNEELSNDDIRRIKEDASTYDFLVINNSNNLSKNNVLIGVNLKAFLVDTNIQFELNPQFSNSTSHYEISNNLIRTDSLSKIAEESFNYSRFFNDPYLELEKSRDIYKNWVFNSFESANKYFILAKEKGIIYGFILFSYNNNQEIIIELISIIKDAQGKGIGSKLISTLLQFAKQTSVSKVKVGTQIDNLQAINFYTKNGFTITEKSSIYHYWPRKEHLND